MLQRIYPKSNFFSRYWHYAPIIVCFLIMLPRLLSPQFGLLDDGRSLKVAEGIVNGKWDLSWEVQVGRSRPMIWLAFSFWYFFADGQPFWYFVGNWIVFSAITFSLINLVRIFGGSKLQSAATGLFFATGGPVIENVYTLTKGENLQLLLLTLVILITSRAVFSKKKSIALAAATLLILAACMTKETSLMMIPISCGWWLLVKILDRKKQADFLEAVSRQLSIASLLAGAFFILDAL